MMIRLRNYSWGGIILAVSAIGVLGPLPPALAAASTPFLRGVPPPRFAPKTPVPPALNRHRRHSACPATPETLLPILLRDLPSYVNRLARRQLRSGRESYVVTASAADLTPLPVKSSEYPESPDKNLHQVFFTTLEREYDRNQLQQWQQHHWVFLTQTAQGWQLALMYSHLAPYPADPAQPQLPARDSSQSLTAEAIRVWLRDCQAGAVKQ
jgi:hypothetical protein